MKLAATALILLVCMKLALCWRQWSHEPYALPSDTEDNSLPLYHFAMIMDKTRNNAFYDVLLANIIPMKSVVLDVGCGSGLLSMMAITLGAKSVICLERNTKMINISKKIFAANGMSSQIHVVHSESFDMYSLPLDIDIVVAEILDAYIIGEGIVSTIYDLRIRGLIPRDATIIPRQATMYMQLVQSTLTLPETSFISGGSHSALNEKTSRSSYQFDFSPLRSQRTSPEIVVPSNRIIVEKNISAVVEVSIIDFQNLGLDVVSAFYDHDYPFTSGYFGYQVMYIPILESGVVHGGMFWFNSSLCENNNGNVWLSNAPSETSSHFGQMFKFFNTDVFVTAGEVLRFEVARMPERLMFTSAAHPAHRLLLVTSECMHPLDIYASSAENDGTWIESEPNLVFSLASEGSYNIMLEAVARQTVRAVWSTGMGTRLSVDHLVEDDETHWQTVQNLFPTAPRDAMIRRFFVPC